MHLIFYIVPKVRPGYDSQTDKLVKYLIRALAYTSKIFEIYIFCNTFINLQEQDDFSRISSVFGQVNQSKFKLCYQSSFP